MTYRPSRREILVSGAAIAALPAVGGSLIPGSAVAQTAPSGTAKTAAQINAYMGAPVELGTASNGAIANKKLLG